jgi:integrase
MVLNCTFVVTSLWIGLLTAYIVRTAKFSSGERFPVLLHRETLRPVTLTTRYVIDVRRQTKQAGTIERDVRVLGWLFDWCERVREREDESDLNSLIRSGKLLSIEQLQGFCRYLRAGRQEKVIAKLDGGGVRRVEVLAPLTFNAYVGVVKGFLFWAADVFICKVVEREKAREAIDEAKKLIEGVLNNETVGGKSGQRKGLTAEELALLRSVIKPGAKDNPFRKSVQFRNYLIIELMLFAGLRRGELLKLKIIHLPTGPKVTLTVIRVSDDPSDPRRHEPKVKTLGREIPLSKDLAKALWEYVRKHRRKGAHQFVFTSHRGGAPLSGSGVNQIFRALANTKPLSFLKGRLHPHILRHTFNDALLRVAEKEGYEGEKLRKLQTYLNGWEEDSEMPERYTRNTTEAAAFSLLVRYQDQLYVEEESVF